MGCLNQICNYSVSVILQKKKKIILSDNYFGNLDIPIK